MRQRAGSISGAAAGPRPPRPAAAAPSGAAPRRPPAAAGGAPPPKGFGAVYGPAATSSAATTVVFGSVSDFSDSQDAGDDARVAESASAAIILSLRAQLVIFVSS